MSITAARKPASKPTAAPLFHGQSTAHQPEVVDDFLCDVLAIARAEMLAEFPGQEKKVDAAIARADPKGRERWGGDRPYIAKRHGEGRSDRNAAIRRDYQRGEAIPLLMRRYSLSRVTIWRVLGMDGEAF